MNMKRSTPQITEFDKIRDKLLPHHSVDCVILGFDGIELKVLLSKWDQLPNWGLPGGFVFTNEDLDNAAIRVLKDRTGLNKIYLKQFHTFGNTQRRSEEEIHNLSKFLGQIDQSIMDWHQKRFVTTGYFALTQISKVNPMAAPQETCQWHSIYHLPTLIFDHSEIIQKALENLKMQLNHPYTATSLLPQKFTMSELQKLYENILNKKLDRANFQRKMLKSNTFIRHEKRMDGSANKAPYLYSYDRSNTPDLLGNNLIF